MSIVLATFVFAAFALLVTGAALLYALRYPARRGETPHCRRCDYNLTGLDLGAGDARCPECGASLRAAHAIVLGERLPTRARRVGGVIVALLACSVLVPVALRVVTELGHPANRPAWLLIRDFRLGSARKANGALHELERRETLGRLTPSQLNQLTEACLAEQAAAAPRAATLSEALQFLGQHYQAGALSAAQRQRFFAEAIANATLEIRSRAPVGGPQHWRRWTSHPSGMARSCSMCRSTRWARRRPALNTLRSR